MAIACFETVKMKCIVPLIMDESSLINAANPLTTFSRCTRFLCGAGAAVQARVFVFLGGGGSSVQNDGHMAGRARSL